MGDYPAGLGLPRCRGPVGLRGAVAEDDSIPPEIPDYALLKRIGSGGYGTVWLARSATGMFRAVKVVQRAQFREVRPYDREYEGVERFEKISITEPSQLALLHVGRNDERGFFYYVMELADDVERGREIDPENYRPRTLRDVLTRAPLAAREVVDLGVALCRALATLHRHGLVHRDVKPSNVIFVGGVPKLADIGLVADEQTDRTVLGTVGYMPREQPASKSADTYALGKVLYELVTGHSREEWPKLPADATSRPDRKRFFELNAVLLRACGDGARGGFADANAMLDELLLLQSGKSVLRLRFLEQRVGQALRAVAILTVIAGVAIAGAWVQYKRAEKAEAERDEERQRDRYAAALSRASRALEQEDYGRARDLLSDAGEPRFRGFEWSALMREAQGDVADIVRSGDHALRRLRLSPNGRWWAFHFGDGTVEVRDGPEGLIKARLRDVSGVGGVSDDGGWLVGTHPQGGPRRWNLNTGESGLVGPDKRIRLLAVDGRAEMCLLFDDTSVNPASELLWWNCGAPAAFRRIVVPSVRGAVGYAASAVTASLDRVALATIEGSGSDANWVTRLWDREAGVWIWERRTGHRIGALALSRTGELLAVGLGDTAEIEAVEASTGNPLWKGARAMGSVTGMSFSHDSSEIAAVGRDSTVRILGSADGKLRQTFRGAQGAINSLVWQPLLAAPITLDSSGEVRRWRREQTASELGGLWRPAGGGRVLCLSDDGLLLAASDDPTRGAGVWRTGDWSLVSRIPGTWMPYAFRGDDLFGIAVPGAWELWNGTEGDRTRTPLGFKSIGVAGVSADRQTVVCGGAEGELAAWDLDTGRELARARIPAKGLIAIAVAPVGGAAVVVDHHLRAYFWNWAAREELRELTRGVLAVSISHNGQHVAVGGTNGDLAIFRLSDGAQLAKRLTDSERLQSVVYSPDGRRIVAGGTRGAVHWFEADSGTEIVSFRCGDDSSMGERTISGVTFSRDGTALAVYMNDGRARLWRAWQPAEERINRDPRANPVQDIRR